MPSLSPQPKSASRHIMLILVVILFVTTMVLVILQSTLKPGTINLHTYSDGYRDGFTRARLLAAGLGASTPGQLTTGSGVVKEVGSNTVTFALSGVIMDEHVDGAGLERVAYINDQTKIVKLVPRDPSTFGREQDEYRKALDKMKPGDVPPTLPSTYTETVLSFSDIKVGDQINVTSVNGQDILPLPAFQVSTIQVSSQ